jgi:hypothetical protein
MATATANARLYKTLCRVLDSLCNEAPPTDIRYHPPTGKPDLVIQARSRALLHLFLKAKFGQTDFALREKLVTDGPLDGGIDAYFIDSTAKKIYLLQSKFRATPSNFTSSNMSVDDLLKMQVKRILKGEKTDESGLAYNDQIIKGLQKSVQKLPDVGNYETSVVLLGNSRKFTSANLEKLVEGYTVDQYHHERIYRELLFPVINGTYFSDPNLQVEISLDNLAKGSTHLDYDAKTSSIRVNIKLLFAPTREIGRVMSTYRNSVLKFNPRSFLELENNPVNRDIEKSIREIDNNEFALYNNGITIISDRTTFSSDTAKQGTAQLILTNPQLVNGGQTAYVLGRIYEECATLNNFRVLRNKEVLLRVITFSVIPDLKNRGVRLGLISAISKASNSQTKIEEADRRSGDEIQIKLQEELFQEHGLYYERKKGEFSDGVREGYITKEQLIGRDKIIRVALASSFQIRAIRTGTSRFFQEEQLPLLLKTKDVASYAYGFDVLQNIEMLQKSRPATKGDRYHASLYGQALRYGMNAVLAVSIKLGMEAKVPPQLAVKAVLDQWKSFETWAQSQESNKAGAVMDFANYYRSSFIGTDLQAYQFKQPVTKATV